MHGETPNDPLAPVLAAQGVVILDGGLATELESRGSDLSDSLWSAGVLLDNPDRVVEVHRSFLEAGADCIASASYQATFEGLAARGLDETQATDLLVNSVQLACRARDEFWAVEENRAGRVRPIVAASVGPYGAYLADGSEYRGDYGLSEEQLMDFHRRRWQILAATEADLLACESVPDHREALALRRLLDETSDANAWISFTCRDEFHLSDGTHLAEIVARIEDAPGILAIGVNCTPPHLLEPLLTAAREATSKPLVAYPNSGEEWDAETRSWTSDATVGDHEIGPSGVAGPLVSQVSGWLALGALLIGGCCRTSPRDIARIRRVLLAPDAR